MQRIHHGDENILLIDPEWTDSTKAEMLNKTRAQLFNIELLSSLGIDIRMVTTQAISAG